MDVDGFRNPTWAIGGGKDFTPGVPMAFNAGMHVKFVLALLVVSLSALAQSLPGTEVLTREGDLSAQMVAGIDAFLLEQTQAASEGRKKYWNRDFSSPSAYEQSVTKNRQRLRQIIGAVDPRLPISTIEFVHDSVNSSLVAETPSYTIQAVRWPVFPRVKAEGLWLKPKGRALGTIIALPDADQRPELLCGLEEGLDHEAQFARRLAEAGFEVFVPELVNRSDAFSGNEAVGRFTNQPHREWIYRQAYELGRHIIGYEVQQVLALLDWLTDSGRKNIGVAGYGEGGLIALYSAALDTRIDAAMVSGYFGPRENLWQEPIYRNLFGFLKEFADAEVASLVAPRALIIEYSLAPEILGPPPARPGRSGGAAPGKIATPERYEVEEELVRARDFFPAEFPVQFELVHGQEGLPLPPGSGKALALLASKLEAKWTPGEKTNPKDQRKPTDHYQRQKRLVRQWEDHTQDLLATSERYRDEHFWKPIGKATAQEWNLKRQTHKARLWEEVLGIIDVPLLHPNPRSRQVYDEEGWTGHEVTLEVWPEVFAWGVLLLPKDLKPGEKRPVVVCQHGLEGVPADTIEGAQNNGYQYYKAFAARLAERGFITFAPHNPYRGRDKFRVLQRKANPLGVSLFSVILGQHEQILNWLERLPFVDSERIGFYGLSYGGKTAMRVPSLLDRYALSICSADFNEWVRKNATVHSPYSYMFTIEYEMPEFDLGHTFNYAEMAALIAPRPFMVERGHDDGVAPDEWVAHEFARVRRFYTKLGIGDRTEIEFFDGPHTINGVGTFKFLHKHLRWPEPSPHP